MSQYFYSYSIRLSHFIRAFDIKYVSVGFNAKSGTKYYVFEKKREVGQGDCTL